ncbi:Fic family protein [Occultella kanbiaonis]|uniref:Fic family protein n=1 Tax=Occultella kanbiaonis TaxID=2675754 RepID=UPI0013D3053D|nr:Fic family protein [Occultella kanbiaonis]
MAEAWPAVGSEEVDWTPAPEVEAHMDVFDRIRRSRPYAATVPAFIADLDPGRHLDGPTWVRVREASAALPAFDAAVADLPVPMPAMLLRSEAASSSQIERLSASARNIAVAQLGISSRENAAEIAANVAAMRTALTAGDRIDEASILAVHTALMKDVAPEVTGSWRDRQVWVGGDSLSPHGADHIGPTHARIPDLMADLAEFAERPDIDPLVLAAVMHAQFETVHPFEDGNGRTGRVLLHTSLRRSRLVRQATVPISAGLLRDTRGYFAALDSYRAGDLRPIVDIVSAGAIDAVENGLRLAQDTGRLREEWLTRIKARRDSTAWRLADALFAQPVVTAEWAATTLDVSDRAARNALAVLEAADVVTQARVAQRARVWQAGEVLASMDAFARRAGRRRA